MNKKDNTSSGVTSHPYCFRSKKHGMASEPLLPSADSDSEIPEAKDLDDSQNDSEKAAIVACEPPHSLDVENGTCSTDYCFFCTQHGPVIKQNSHNNQQCKTKAKSQSLQLLNSFCSNGTDDELQLLGDNNNLVAVRMYNSVSAIESAGITTMPSKSSVRDPSISSSLSKLTDLRESCGLMCRICHSGNEDEELIRPCKCTGTVKYAHQSCILNWVSKSGHQSCELCKFKFKTRKESVKCFWKVQ